MSETIFEAVGIIRILGTNDYYFPARTVCSHSSITNTESRWHCKCCVARTELLVKFNLNLSVIMTISKIMNVNFLNVINIVLVILGLVIIGFTSIFWLGTVGDYNYQINSNKFNFLFDRLILNIVCSLLIILFITITLYVCKYLYFTNAYLKKLIILDTIVLILAALIGIFLVYL